MPVQSLLERVSIEQLERDLNRLETLDAVAKLYSVSYRTVERAIKGKLEAFQCWRRVPPTIDATFTATVTTQPVDSEGKAQ